MLEVSKVWGRSSKLAKGLSATDTELKLVYGDGLRFDLPYGTHYYATIINGGTREVVKVVGRLGDTLNVERGVDNTTAQTFPANSCVKVEWNPQQLCEFVKQCATGDSAKIKAQTVCMSCDTCLDIDEGGHIINVNGSKTC